MNRRKIAVFLLLVLPVMLACGLTKNLTDAVTGGDEFAAAADLWADVPRMDGLTKNEDMELPLGVKLLMRTILGNLGKLNPEGQDQTTGKVDWIAFEAAGSPDDVRNFYTPERMAGSSWQVEGGEACAGASSSGVSQTGTVCNFTKTEGGMQHMLVIFATQDEAGKPTSVFFLRMAFPETPQQ